jgi:hypothetical protein
MTAPTPSVEPVPSVKASEAASVPSAIRYRTAAPRDELPPKAVESSSVHPVADGAVALWRSEMTATSRSPGTTPVGLATLSAVFVVVPEVVDPRWAIAASATSGEPPSVSAPTTSVMVISELAMTARSGLLRVQDAIFIAPTPYVDESQVRCGRAPDPLGRASAPACAPVPYAASPVGQGATASSARMVRRLVTRVWVAGRKGGRNPPCVARPVARDSHSDSEYDRSLRSSPFATRICAKKCMLLPLADARRPFGTKSRASATLRRCACAC